ncbi:MAG: CoA transferase [Sphingomonadales bacterium]|nr:MAG: CoA transferase [Sphingomonadales bacterium]
MSPRALDGIKVVEFEGLGPAPTCAMLLADFGAEVLRVSRPGYEAWADPVTGRGKGVFAADLKDPVQLAEVRAAIALADVLIEPYRPGVMERLGLGPSDVEASNPGLIYVRMTGWGQTGPLSQRAGHDINYIALSGALEGIGRPGEVPTPPLNLIGDMGAGAAICAFGICAALLERVRSGRGQVIDASIADGTAALMAMFHGMNIPLTRQDSPLGGSQPWYDCYVCADGRHVAVGALEPQFWAILVDAIGLAEHLRDRQRAEPDTIRAAMAAIFATRTRDEWAEQLMPLDACVTPVLSIDEAREHPYAQHRSMYDQRNGVSHPAPAPRLSRSPAAISADRDGSAMLKRWASTGR